jgi:hypothetical protein
MQIHFQQLRENWLGNNSTRAGTKAGNESAPPIELVLSWIAAAWSAVLVELIVNSFLACGITANVDASNIVSAMTCFKDGGQLVEHKQSFLAALHCTTDNDDDAIVDTN